jgi:hypothetical protein
VLRKWYLLLLSICFNLFLFIKHFYSDSRLILKFETKVNQLGILRQRVARLLKCRVHRLNSLSILHLKLWIHCVNYLLQGLVADNLRKGPPSQVRWVFTLGALGFLIVLDEILVDARFAKTAKTLVDCVSVSKVPIAHRALEERVEVAFL